MPNPPAKATSRSRRSRNQRRLPLVRSPFGTPASAHNSSGFPQRMRMTHKYCEAIFATAAAGSIKLWVLSANGMFDPNITGTGHQPTYFDAMTAIYDHYTVLKSRITVTALTHTATSTADNFVVGVVQHDNPSPAFTTAANCCEQPVVQYALMDGDPGDANVTAQTFHLTFDARKTFGSMALSDAQLRGDSSSNPTEQNYFVLFAQDSNLTNAVAVDYLVTIEYEAEWTELKANLTN